MPLTNFDLDGQGTSSSYIFGEEKFYDVDGLKENKSERSSSSGRSSNVDQKEMLAQLRREKDKIRARERRSKESEEARQLRREKCKLAQARRRKEETEEQRQHRLAVDRERAKRRRMKETKQQKQIRLEMNRVRTAVRRQGTVENAIEALKMYHEDPEVKSLLEMPGNRIVQLEDPNDPMKITIGIANDSEPDVFYRLTSFKKETEEQKQKRLAKGRVYAAKRRMEETVEQREKRLERERTSTRKRRNRKSQISDKSRSTSVMDSAMDSTDCQNSENEVESEIILENEPEKEPEPEALPQPEQDDPPMIGIENNALIDLSFPQASTSADHLNFNGCFLNPASSNPLGMQNLSGNDLSNWLDFSQIYSHVLQPPVSLSESPVTWVSTAENVLKDKNDIYLIQNFGIDSSASPLPSTTNIFNNLNQPTNSLQTTTNLFPEDANPIGMLLRNLSNNSQVIEGTAFNQSFNAANNFLGAGLGISSPGASVFGNLDGRIDSLLQIGTNFNNPHVSNSPLTLNLQSEIEIDQPVSVGHFFRTDDDVRFGSKDDNDSENRLNIKTNHFDTIVRNSLQSLTLLFEATAEQLEKEGCQVNLSSNLTFHNKMLLPNNGLHLVVSGHLIETEWIALRNLYYSSLCRLLKTKDEMETEELYGDDSDDRCTWSEMYDTIRALHLELSQALFEKRKTDTVDTSCFNAVERAELSMKKTLTKKRYQTNRRMTFLDFALVELLDFLDQIAQITWMVFPYLNRERSEIRTSIAYRRLLNLDF